MGSLDLKPHIAARSSVDANKEAFKSLLQDINGCVMEIALIKTKWNNLKQEP